MLRSGQVSKMLLHPRRAEGLTHTDLVMVMSCTSFRVHMYDGLYFFMRRDGVNLQFFLLRRDEAFWQPT